MTAGIRQVAKVDVYHPVEARDDGFYSPVQE
jgi:hypothetical protein